MGVPRIVRERFGDVEPSLDRLEPYVIETLRRWCDDPEHRYPVVGRKKDVESVSEKLGTGRFRKWSELDDLLAFTIVVPTRSHEGAVLDMLAERFIKTRVRSQTDARKAPDVFRFDATRWYGTVPGNPTPTALLEEDLTVEFEIQIKTAFEHAWSTVTHALVYKGQRVEWRHKRLAAQLKALVEQVDSLIDHFEASAEAIPESPDWQTDAQTKIIETFATLELDGVLDEQVRPLSWQRFAESVFEIERASTRNARDAAGAVHALCDNFDEAVRSGTFKIAASGTLVQAVVAFIITTRGDGPLKDIPVVWDGDLAPFYANVAPPKVVDFAA